MRRFPLQFCNHEQMRSGPEVVLADEERRGGAHRGEKVSRRERARQRGVARFKLASQIRDPLVRPRRDGREDGDDVAVVCIS